jgi:hypothetical protein
MGDFVFSDGILEAKRNKAFSPWPFEGPPF